MTKKCNRCLETKDVAIDFFKNPYSPDGIKSLCKVCTRNKCREYENNNRDKCRAIHKKTRDRNIDYYRQMGKIYAEARRKSHPWEQSYYMAKDRCTNTKRRSYRYYGAQGIKFELTLDDVRMIWFRDKAYELKQPSIDRKDTYGNYSLGNCRFIEMVENSRRPKRKRIKES